MGIFRSLFISYFYQFAGEVLELEDRHDRLKKIMSDQLFGPIFMTFREKFCNSNSTVLHFIYNFTKFRKSIEFLQNRIDILRITL